MKCERSRISGGRKTSPICERKSHVGRRFGASSGPGGPDKSSPPARSARRLPYPLASKTKGRDGHVRSIGRVRCLVSVCAGRKGSPLGLRPAQRWSVRFAHGAN
jgi:hypothetical protein